MASEIIVPKVDMVMETATFLEWLKKEGDTVQKGEPLFIIETDKAAIEVEAVESGILAGISAKPQEVFPVTAVIGYLLKPGEALPSPKATPAAAAAQKTAPAGQPPVASLPSVPAVGIPTDGPVRATPLARKIAKEHGLDLRQIKGRGPLGRIYRADIITNMQVPPQPSSQGLPPLMAAVAAPPAQLPKAEIRARVPLKGPRAIIAQRMSFSAASIPHIYETITVDVTEIFRLREKLAAEIVTRTGHKLTYTAIITLVVARTLVDHPAVNSSLAGEEIIQWQDVNIGLATDLDENLIVPVVKKAHLKDLGQIVGEIGRLIDAARSRKLTPVDMMDGTFTISNLGMYGIESFTAIINPPEAAILAVGKIVEEKVGSGIQPEERRTMKITLGADHRILDGAKVAKFLIDLKTRLENPYPLLFLPPPK